MWFKNILLYRFTSSFDIDDDALEQALQNTPFAPCGSQDLARVGWVSAMPDSDMLSHAANGCVLLCLRRQQKILPAGAVAEALEERVREIEKAEARKIYRKERKQLKEEIAIDLLPRALTRSSRCYAYIDRRNGWLLVDSSSHARAEELLTQLRNDVGTLPVQPLQTNSDPVTIMTHWLQSNELPPNFALGQQCELRDRQESSNVVRVRGQELSSDEVLQHLTVGKQVAKIELLWHEAIECVLGEDLIVRRLRFTDALREQMDSQDDPRAAFDQEFAVMTMELAKFLDGLLPAFGGTLVD
jgi:recombination associated protein RdgC